MKTVVLQCDQCSTTSNVGALMAGETKLVLKALCDKCRIIITCYISYEGLKSRVVSEQGQHVVLTATSQAVAAHA